MAVTRSATIYTKAITDLKVETANKYQKNGSTTYCNIFAQDVMNSSTISSPLPSGTCATMLNSLSGNAYPPWNSVDYISAQIRANAGYPTIGITSDHVVVVRPNGGTSVGSIDNIQIAQAGSTNYENTTLNYAWVKADRPNVKFYSCL